MTQASDASSSSRAIMFFGRALSRRTLLLGLTAICVVGGAVYLTHRLVQGGEFESTDDAYVGGNLVQLMPQVSGSVLTIYADESDLVHAGQTLVKLDEADRDIALEQAKAELAQAVRDVRVMFASRDQLNAELSVRQSEVARAKSDVQRREGLTARGLVPREELDHARDTLATAEAALQAGREALAATQARIDGTTIKKHPNVARASARVKDAYLAVQRTTIRAPITGYVAKRSVQVGQRAEPGVPMMAIVPLDDLWVDANFKEVQLDRMRIGQTARLTADVYGQKVEYAGKVSGLGIGTGAAFALLPPQNASGNWIKVVQRVPVRIRLDPAQLAKHPLRLGLSMRVRVDLSAEGPQLAQAPRSTPAYEIAVPQDDAKDVELIIRDIVAANLSGRAAPIPKTDESESSVARVTPR